MPRSRELVFKLIACVIGATIGLLVVEAGARFWLYSAYSEKSKSVGNGQAGFHVRWPASISLGPYGFDYGGREGHYIQLTPNAPGSCLFFYTGPFGEFPGYNLDGWRELQPFRGEFFHGNAQRFLQERMPVYDAKYGWPSWNSAEIKIAVFGDSFSIFWPPAVEKILSARTGKKVRVINFSRSGIGLLTMVDMADHWVQQLKPDLVLFAFITGDLSRGRFWDGVGPAEGTVAPFIRMSSPPGRASVLETIVPQMRVVASPHVPELCETKSGADILQRIKQDYASLSAKVGNPYREFLFDWRTLYFFKMMRGSKLDDSYFRVSGMPLYDHHSLLEDGQFKSAIARLKSSGVKTTLVHIPNLLLENANRPVHPGQVFNADREVALYESLKSAFQSDVNRLASKLPAERTIFYDLIVSEADPHPNPLGNYWIADQIADLVVEKLRLPTVQTEEPMPDLRAATYIALVADERFAQAKLLKNKIVSAMTKRHSGNKDAAAVEFAEIDILTERLMRGEKVPLYYLFKGLARLAISDHCVGACGQPSADTLRSAHIVLVQGFGEKNVPFDIIALRSHFLNLSPSRVDAALSDLVNNPSNAAEWLRASVAMDDDIMLRHLKERMVSALVKRKAGDSKAAAAEFGQIDGMTESLSMGGKNVRLFLLLKGLARLALSDDCPTVCSDSSVRILKSGQLNLIQGFGEENVPADPAKIRKQFLSLSPEQLDTAMSGLLNNPSEAPEWLRSLNSL